MNRVIREPLLKLDESILQGEKNASRGADGVEGTYIHVSCSSLEQGDYEPTTTGKWSACLAISVILYTTYLDGSLESTRTESDEYQSHRTARHKGAMRIKSMITDSDPFHRVVSAHTLVYSPHTHPKSANCQSTKDIHRVARATQFGGIQ